MNWKSKLYKYFGIMFLRYPLAIIAVLFFCTKDKLHLTKLTWLETIDWPLSGDNGWREEHLWGSNPLSFINRVRWLWRNGGNRYNYEVLGVVDNIDWRECTPQGYGYFVRKDEAWLRRIKINLCYGRFLQCIFGWNLFGPQYNLCKYVCTIRIKTKE